MLLRIANIIFVLGRVYFRDSRSFTLRKLYGEAKIGQETKKGMANVQTIQTLGVLYVHQSHLAFSGTFFFGLVCFSGLAPFYLVQGILPLNKVPGALCRERKTCTQSVIALISLF